MGGDGDKNWQGTWGAHMRMCPEPLEVCYKSHNDSFGCPLTTPISSPTYNYFLTADRIISTPTIGYASASCRLSRNQDEVLAAGVCHFVLEVVAYLANFSIGHEIQSSTVIGWRRTEQ